MQDISSHPPMGPQSNVESNVSFDTECTVSQQVPGWLLRIQQSAQVFTPFTPLFFYEFIR